MAKLILILGDQLSPALASLRDVQPDDVILLAEVQAEANYVKHHQLKIVLIFSAMRHFAQTLREQGHQVHYIHYTAKVTSLYQAACDTFALYPHLNRLVVTEAAEYRLQQELLQFETRLNLPVSILEDDRFIANHGMFQRWAHGRNQFRMEYFYREMRRYTGLLMEGAQPCGGQWNFDADNRRQCPADVVAPEPQWQLPDEITQQVIELVQQEFPENMGDAASFRYAVTGKAARAAFLYFVEHQLAKFGDYQDAMRCDDTFLFHSVCSMYLNVGLLDARWMCQKVDQAWRQQQVPLNAAEGFIRQIIGWREYVRGLYWLLMPSYQQQNYLETTTQLPSYYWHGQTKMRCMQQAIGDTIQHAYSHHIHRLMITGNFALLAGLDVKEVSDWYLAVYADAFEWVELPNTLGMALFADGGVLASKPYAASGNYIQRMSNYCQHCHYQVKLTTGEKACPFNALYWDFLARNEQKLGGNARLQLAYQQWRRKNTETQTEILAKAADLLIKLEQL
jgi:deoxyribodipyrimidine photolyase-related protein